jgi:hypothetical protein
LALSLVSGLATYALRAGGRNDAARVVDRGAP